MRYSQYEGYDVECRLIGSEQYCKKHSGSPCCFFCKEKQTCRQACKNEPIACDKAVCRDKNRRNR